jgi:precorrin-6A/cobalt-precorrin-6A reductase
VRILILGGSTEASQLASRLAGNSAIFPVLSLAGRTKNPVLPPIPFRSGGFGGVSGLASYLRQEAIDVVIDATHPFAERMSLNAQEACRETGVPLAVYTRLPWTPKPGDRWTEVPDIPGAVSAIGEHPRRIFLTVGRQQISPFEAAPQHYYVIRSVDPPDPPPSLPRYRLVLARGPFPLDAETQLITSENIDVIVTKNSGGDAARAKLDAAREKGIEVVLIRPPVRPEVRAFYDIDSVLGFLRSLNHALVL